MIYDDLAKSHKGIANFYTVDFENGIGLVNEYGVVDAPTVLFYKSGKLVNQINPLY
jgi:hypothetical protein